MGSLVSFERKLDSLVLEEVKQQAEQSWLSPQTMPTEIVDALVAEVKQLQRRLHDERVRRDEDEWKKMNNRLIAGTEVEHLQERLEQVKTALDREVDSRVCAELEVERLQAMRVTKRQRLTEQGIRINRFEAALASTQEDLAETRAELDRMRGDMQEQSDEVQELWLSPCEAEGLRRQLAEMETVARLHEHALNERDEALAAEHQLCRETEYCYRAALTMARNRGDRLEKAESLAALVTPELAGLLRSLARTVELGGCPETAKQTRALAARIRETLEETE